MLKEIYMFFASLSLRGQVLLFTFLLGTFSITAYSQTIEEVVGEEQNIETVLEVDQFDAMAETSFEEAELTEDSRLKIFFRKLGDQFKVAAKKVSKTISPDDKKRIARKKRRLKRKAERQKRIQNGTATKGQRILYGLGKASSAVTTAISRPFIHGAGFLTGFFQKENKDKDAEEFLKFFVNHEKEFDPLYKNTGNVESFALKIEEKLEDIINRKTVKILSDVVAELTDKKIDSKVIKKTLGIMPYAEDESINTIAKDLQDVIFSVDQSKFSADLINEHPEYQELRGLLGDIKEDQLAQVLLNQNFTPDVDHSAILGGSRIKLYEGLIAFSSRLFLPKMVLSFISKGLGSLALGVTLAADIGTATSVAMCTLNKKNIAKLNDDSDADLKDFCSYVVNRSAYLISKSRAKGFLSGKKSKRGFKKFLNKTFKSKKKSNKSKALNQVQMM